MVVKTAKIYPQSSFQYMLDILKKKKIFQYKVMFHTMQ